jgi:hypothetical protein
MGKHQESKWVLLRKRMRPRLTALLPMPCPRCGQVMERGMLLDLGHISRAPELTYEPSNVRLEHRHCNRRDGQRVTTAKRMMRKPVDIGKRMPNW